MSILSQLFPDPSRKIPGKRHLSVLLRSLHLVGIAGLAGHFLFDLAPAQWLPYAIVALGSGGLMVAMELWCDGIWLLQLRGQAILLKLLLLAGAVMIPTLAVPLFVLIVLISGFFAHAPGKVRYYSLWHGRVVKALRGPDGLIRDCGQP